MGVVVKSCSGCNMVDPSTSNVIHTFTAATIALMFSLPQPDREQTDGKKEVR